MAKRKKLIITREGYLVLAAIGVLLLALIIIAVATKGFGACSKGEGAQADATPGASEYHPAPTNTPKPTQEEELTSIETPAPETPSGGASDSPAPTVPLSDDPNALTAPTADMIAGAAEGKLIKSGVRMRQGPSTNTTIIATGLKSGTRVTVYAEDGDFYFVLMNDTKKYGYISKQFIKLLTPLGEAPAGNDQPEGTVRGSVTNTAILRDGPVLTATKLGQYEVGQMVYVFHQEGEYYYVQIAGTDLKGYLFAQFVKPEGTVPQKDA